MKPGTFTQLYIHLIFAVKYRESLLVKNIQPEVFSYITGILRNRRHKPMAVNGMPDHTHIFFSYNQNDKLPDLIASIKKESSLFINQKNWLRYRFQWQEGYGAFSYSKSQVDVLVRYIINQEEHHKKKTFLQEYISFLKKFEIEFDERYLFYLPKSCSE